MTRTLCCPQCRKKLRLDESLKLLAGLCPDCGTKFRIPQANKVPTRGPAGTERYAPPDRTEMQGTGPITDFESHSIRDVLTARHTARSRKVKALLSDDDEPLVEAQGQEKVAISHRVQSHCGAFQKPMIAQYDDSKEEQEPHDLPGPRGGNKKKKRKRSAGMSLELSNFFITLGFLGLIWLASTVLVLIEPDAFLLALIVGFVIASIGQRWFLRMAWEDGLTVGLCCIFIPLYPWYYLYTNFERVLKPVVVRMSGLIIILTACLALALRVGIGNVLDYVPFFGGMPTLHEFEFDGADNWVSPPK